MPMPKLLPAALALAPRRRPLLSLAALLAALALLLLAARNRVVRYAGGDLPGPPPAYEDIYAWERALPQHDAGLAPPEGAEGRYVKFSNQIIALGWNNVLNEILLCSHLAYKSGRAYVFQDYLWKPAYYPWRIPVRAAQAKPASPHTPLNALLSGPTAGAPWPAGDPAPRAVSARWFDVVCPRAERRIIYTDGAKAPVKDAPGDEVMAHWVRLLRDAPERCVEVVAGPSVEDGYPQVFDLWLVSTARVLPLWDEFAASPVSRLLSASPLVESAVARNEYLFGAARAPHKRTLAAHVRRGDFARACGELARWNATFYGWNLLPALPDAFAPPPGGAHGRNTPENVERYRARCFPPLGAVVAKIREATGAWEGNGTAGEGARALDTVYLLTDAEPAWVEAARRALRADGWERVVASGDLRLDKEQRGVGMAVDMELARRAAVFVGNGWSSFTSNVVHRRLVDGREPLSIRFW